MTAGQVKETNAGSTIYKVWFFAGAETMDDKFNVFTGSFIRLMKEILGDSFDFIRGINSGIPVFNVARALLNAQRPVRRGPYHFGIRVACDQILERTTNRDTQIILTSSSSGSIFAAQAACYLAEGNRNNLFFRRPFHLVLGASMLSPDSDLYRRLQHYQREGLIGTILHEEMQDIGDNTFGIGGTSRREAFRNALGVAFPYFSHRYYGPSFLNKNPQTGHIHRIRSHTVQKALDYIEIILIKHTMAGQYFSARASEVLAFEKEKLSRKQTNNGH
ncbi:MAG: hypothetical protein MUD02_00315 [Bacteroidales bacterium]|jgi:hypothetical protein|nr:hypothetical protein [Bacteroidales bacterium]